MSQQDLFGRPRVYPIDAGWKEPSQTSAQAAQTIDAESLRERVLFALDWDGPMTADEVANFLGVDRLAIRPWFSELFALGKIEKTQKTRPNASGKQARVWRVRG